MAVVIDISVRVWSAFESAFTLFFPETANNQCKTNAVQRCRCVDDTINELPFFFFFKCRGTQQCT